MTDIDNEVERLRAEATSTVTHYLAVAILEEEGMIADLEKKIELHKRTISEFRAVDPMSRASVQSVFRHTQFDDLREAISRLK